MSRKKKAKPAVGFEGAAALWDCARGSHKSCTGGPVLRQHALVTAGQATTKEHPLVLDYVCPCECHRRKK